MKIILRYFIKLLKNKYEKLIMTVKIKYAKIKSYVDNIESINSSKIAYEDLAPKDNIDKGEVYFEALDWALSKDKVFNIALAGAYGSGKSSILRTYKKKRSHNNYLNISLASFQDTIAVNKHEIGGEENSKRSKLNDLEIEKGIIQQLFYKVKSKRIPYTRFRKIKNLSTKDLIVKIVFVLIIVIASILIFSPNLITKVKSNIDTLRGFDFSITSIIMIYIVFFVFFIIIMINILKYFNKGIKLNKINLEKAEIELEKTDDESIFNRYLDEILYFFEVTNYNVVFIEDLDRFDDINIFTKLRELNSLINNSEQINKKVVFIYAIKDEMFANKDRTKFFEFIIPVIPVVNSSNSGELLFEKIEKDNLKESLSKRFINDIAIYIDDMRILNNIYNEFLLYKQRLDNVPLKLEKLFAMIVYKNIYPDDFAKLQYDEGVVYQAFEKKAAIILKKVKEKKDACLDLEQKLSFIEKEHLNSICELKAAFMYALVGWRTDINVIRLNNNDISISSIYDDNYELNLWNDKKISVFFKNGNGPIYTTMKDIDANSGNEKTFLERIEIAKLKNKSRIEQIKQEISALKAKEIRIKQWSLSEAIQEVGLESFFDEKSKAKKLIIFLLRNCHIDEMYLTYITHFYVGSLTQKDMSFVMSVKDQEPLEPSYQLTKINEIINRLNYNEFERSDVLNYSLVDFILEYNIKYDEYFKIIIRQLSNESENSITFINSFKDITKYKKLFIKLLSNNWNNIWVYIEEKSNFSISKKDEYLKNIIMFGNIEDIININKDYILTKYISENAGFINLMCREDDTEKIQNVIKELDVKFKRIDNDLDNTVLLEFIFKNNLYEINKDMIELIVQQKFPDGLQNVFKCNYTTIEQMAYLPLCNYINENFDEYVDNVFLKLDSNDSETEKMVIDLLSREKRSKEIKYKIIEKEKAVFNNITNIDNELWGKAINDNKIKLSWFNIINYYDLIKKIDEIIISFITKSNNYIILSSFKCDSDSDFEENIYKMFSEDIIRFEEIEENIFMKLSESIPYKYKELDISSLRDDRVCSLISCNLLDFTVENYNSLRENHKDRLVRFIEINIDLYLKEQSDFEIDIYDLTDILSSIIITIEHKVALISKIDTNTLNDNLELAELICDIMLSYTENTEMDQQMIEYIFRNSSTETKKVRLLSKLIKNLGTEDITKYLIILGSVYEGITINRKRPLIDNTDINYELVRQLTDYNYIASFNNEDDKLRIHTKYK